MSQWDRLDIDHTHLLDHFDDRSSEPEKSYFRSRLSTEIVPEQLIDRYWLDYWASASWYDDAGDHITCYEIRTNKKVGKSKQRQDGSRDDCYFIKIYEVTASHRPVAIFPCSYSDSICHWTQHSDVSTPTNSFSYTSFVAPRGCHIIFNKFLPKIGAVTPPQPDPTPCLLNK